MTTTRGLIKGIKLFLFGNRAPTTPVSPDMASVCSKCKIMDLYIKDVEKMHKFEAKYPQAPIQTPEPKRIRRGRKKQ